MEPHAIRRRLPDDLAADLWAEAIGATGAAVMTGAGPCMEPAIPSGSRMRVQAVDGAACRVGDVVVYRTPMGFTAHRVVGRFRWGRRTMIVHKGDNSAVWGTIPAEAVAARVLGLPGRSESRLLGRYYAAVAFVTCAAALAVRRLPGPRRRWQESALGRRWYAITLLLARQLDRPTGNGRRNPAGKT
ncbi:MAG: hypothetical protein HY331_10210 [Chloroflexi bacterium]|nr:hypothetical protein [Chloroflexota bacterium]